MNRLLDFFVPFCRHAALNVAILALKTSFKMPIVIQKCNGTSVDTFHVEFKFKKSKLK
jgi:hypothetical protein